LVRYGDGEACSAVAAGGYIHAAAEAVEAALDEVEAEAAVVGLGGKALGEDAVGEAGADAGAAVGDGDGEQAVFVGELEGDAFKGGVGDGVEGVVDEVADNCDEFVDGFGVGGGGQSAGGGEDEFGAQFPGPAEFAEQEAGEDGVSYLGGDEAGFAAARLGDAGYVGGKLVVAFHFDHAEDDVEFVHEFVGVGAEASA
jgi:hypothetical protein